MKHYPARKLLNPKRWWLFSSILWRVFDEQDFGMFGHYGCIVVRVPWIVAWDVAFEEMPK